MGRRVLRRTIPIGGRASAESRVQSVSLDAVSVTPNPRPSSRPRPAIQVGFGIGDQMRAWPRRGHSSERNDRMLFGIECMMAVQVRIPEMLATTETNPVGNLIKGAHHSD